MSKQNPIRAHAATKIRYFSDRLLAVFVLGSALLSGVQTPAQTQAIAFIDGP